MKVLWLHARLALAIALLFALVYGLLVVIAYLAGYAQPVVMGVLALFIVLLQYLASPRIIEVTMRVKYIHREDMPELYGMVERLAEKAGIPMPRVGIAQVDVPNAFAFGRSVRDGRVCVTRGLLNVLNDEELEAVLGHELSHLRHRDMVVLATLSVIPLISYFIFWSFLWSRRRGDATLIALAAFGVYILSNFLVLYVSRIREYYADFGSAELTGKPHALASALYRITAATTSLPRERVRQVEGMKAFFATDPSRARADISDVTKADLNMDGHLDEYEVRVFASRAQLSRSDKIMELFSSHPNVVERIKRLAGVP
ncbi:MAG TPA: peptidase [Thermoplasmatales archaeon]|nr:peptidase [Thermoplasmatales archaeon]